MGVFPLRAVTYSAPDSVSESRLWSGGFWFLHGDGLASAMFEWCSGAVGGGLWGAVGWAKLGPMWMAIE